MPTQPSSAPDPDGLDVTVDGGRVVVRAGGTLIGLTPDAASWTAERLLVAAEQARDGGDTPDRKPPFEPAKLVSPRGAG